MLFSAIYSKPVVITMYFPSNGMEEHSELHKGQHFIYACIGLLTITAPGCIPDWLVYLIVIKQYWSTR